MKTDIVIGDDLRREVFAFSLTTQLGEGPPTLRLERYADQTRPTKRHSIWKTHRGFTRLGGRYNDCAVILRREDVPLSEEIIAKAKDQFASIINSIEVQ